MRNRFSKFACATVVSLLMAGIFAWLGVGVNSWLSLVGEVASNRKTYDAPGDDITQKVDFYGAGLRFAGHGGKAHPYAQVLVGAARGRISLLGQRESGSDFAWQRASAWT